MSAGLVSSEAFSWLVDSCYGYVLPWSFLCAHTPLVCLCVTETAHGQKPCEDEGRGQGGGFTSQGTPKVARKTPEARRVVWNRVFLTALRSNPPCQHLDLGLTAAGAARRDVSVVEATSLWCVKAALANSRSKLDRI